MSVFSHALSTNNYGAAKFIVSSSAANGTHTTLASAMAAASSGDTIFLRDSVTENVTITPGVNISAWQGSALNTPSITGKLTMTGAGTSTISGITLITNSDFFLAVTGSAASVINLNNCYLNALNNTGISFTSSSGSAEITATNCYGDIGTTGISLFASSSAGFIIFNQCFITNSGGSTTASTISAGQMSMQGGQALFPITTSSTGSLVLEYVEMSATNVSCLTINGSASSQIEYVVMNSGNASAISIGASGVLIAFFCRITSSNTNAITGSGSLIYAGLIYGTSQVMNVTTQIPKNSGTFTPGISFGGSATGITYNFQAGYYTIFNNVINFSISISLTSKGAQTGNALVTGFPFTSGPNGNAQIFPVPQWANFSLTATYTSLTATGAISGTTFPIFQFSPSLSNTQLTNAQFMNNSSLSFTGTLIIV